MLNINIVSHYDEGMFIRIVSVFSEIYSSLIELDVLYSMLR